MKKTIVGFDIGTTQTKIAVLKGGGVQVYVEPTPENLTRNGEVQTPNMMTDYLKRLRKELKLPKGPCALVLPDAVVVCRTVTLPAMTESQLQLNLPFEFSDYISEEPQKYVYDYAMLDMSRDEEGNPQEMTLMAAAMSKERSHRYYEMFRDAGFKLQTLLPQEMALTSLTREALKAGRIGPDQEYCIINLAHRGTEVFFFRGAALQILRSIPLGGADIDQAIAERENLDPFAARTRKNANYNSVLESEYCQEVFTRLSVEVMKVINFYRFNNRGSELSSVYFAGGGSAIASLRDTIAETCGLEGRPLGELLPRGAGARADAAVPLMAISALIQ